MADGKVQFDIGEGQVLLVETDVPEGPKRSGIRTVSKKQNNETVIESNKKFEDVAKSIAPVANTILQSLKEINTPKEIQLEFGVKLDFASNVLIAKASTEANFKIMLKWENKDESCTEK